MGPLISAAINALLDWMIDGAVKAWETACKFALQAGSMDDNQWQVVSETVGKVSMPMLLLTVIFAAIAMIRELIAGNIGNVWIVFFRSVLAWPLTLFSIWIAVMTCNLATSMTGKILHVDMTGGSGVISLPTVDKPNLSSLMTLMGGLLMLFMILLMIVGACSIILCMAARTFMLIVILSFAGVAFMYLNDASNKIARRYLKYVIGIILYQPLCAVFINITGRLMSLDGMSNPISFFTGVVGMILASVMPWVLVSMVAKAGIPVSEGTKGVASAGAKTVGAAESAVKAAVKVAVQALLHGCGRRRRFSIEDQGTRRRWRVILGSPRRDRREAAASARDCIRGSRATAVGRGRQPAAAYRPGSIPVFRKGRCRRRRSTCQGPCSIPGRRRGRIR